MRYRDIQATASKRFQLPSSHPILATLRIEAADWRRLQELDADNPATHLLGYDEPHDERLTVYVACASREVSRRLEDGWC